MLYEASIGEATNVYINNPMIKMAAMTIYGKNLSNIFSGTGGPISTKLGMYQWGLEYYNVDINDDLGLFYGNVSFGRICS